MAHVASGRKASMSLVTNELAMSSSVVQSINVIRCTRSSIAFACGFLALVGIHLISYDSHRYSASRITTWRLGPRLHAAVC